MISDICVEFVVNSYGSSALAQNSLFKDDIFGIYRISKIDANGNAIYRKADTYKDTDLHFHIFKGSKAWMVKNVLI